jgi:hypothetical protein
MFHSRALMRCAWGLPVVAAVVVGVAAQAQTPAAPPMPPQPPAPLTIAGDVPKPLTLSPADLKTYPRTTVTIQDEGRAVTYEGVRLGELVAPGDKRGARSIRMLERIEIVRVTT